MTLRWLVRAKRSHDDRDRWHIIKGDDIDQDMDESGEVVLELFPLEEPLLSPEESVALNAVFDLDDVGGHFFVQVALEKILDRVTLSQ